MATRDMGYAEPAYLVPQTAGFTVAAGSGTIVRFALVADSIMRSVWVKPVTAGTVTDISLIHAVTGTTTKVLGSATTTGAQTAFTRLELTTASRTCTAGDEIRFTKGTDATVVYAIGIEYVYTPNCQFTV